MKKIKMFENRNHLEDPMINLVCPYCSRDLYPFKSNDRFELVLETLSELKGNFIKIKCFSCKSIFRVRRSYHKAWIKHYYQIIKEIFEKKTEEALIIRVNSSFKKMTEKTKGEKQNDVT